MAFPHSVVAHGRVYVGGGATDNDEDQYTVMVYEQGAEWRTLPRYQYRRFAMAALQDQLTLVGGWDPSTGKATNQIAVWNSQQWAYMYPYPQMPTSRSLPAVVTYIKWLVVAGGRDDSYLSTVEIMDTTNKQWFTATPLPVECCGMTSAVVAEECYLMGGFANSLLAEPTKQVFQVSLPAITSQAVSQWYNLPDTPLEFSAALTANGSLLAVGGRHGQGDFSSAIHLYQPERGLWVRVGDLPTARFSCSCTLLPSGEILAAGGYDGNKISQVDVASVGELF